MIRILTICVASFDHSSKTNLGIVFCMECLLLKSVIGIPVGNPKTPASG